MPLCELMAIFTDSMDKKFAGCKEATYMLKPGVRTFGF